VVAALVVLPIAVLVVALGQRTWYPTGDQAQAELRMLSLPGDVPLVGAAGRIIADDGTQGNHPGPLMFWATWPLYEALGGSSWAFEAATAAVAAAGLVAAVALVARRAPPPATAWFGAVAVVLVGGFGLDALTQPWNPWVALVPFLLLVLSTWAVLDGARWPLVLAVAGASYALQGHVGYAPLVPLVLVAIGALLWRERSVWRDRAGWRRLAPIPVAVLVGLALWSGPLVDVARNDPSNVDILLEHFGTPDEDPIGLADGVEAVLQASNPWGSWVAASTGVDGSIVPGLVLVLAWAGVAVAVAVRRLDATLTRLNAVVGLALLLGVLAVSRVFGALFLYTFRWIVVLVALEVFTLGWGVVRLVGSRLPSVAPARARVLQLGALGLVLVLGVVTSVRLVGQDIPYGNSWRTERELARAATAEVDLDRSYLVRWEDPVYLGGLAFGLILDLERHGATVGADPTYSAAVEPHRVMCPGDYDAVLTVVTGTGAIETWQARPDAREVAMADIRTDAARAEGERDRQRLAQLLGVDDPAAVDGLLSTLVLDPSQPAEVLDLAGSLVDAGVPTAVFETAPDPADAPDGC
jgi:hypothetical protein